MAAAGVKSALCINQEVGNAGLDARCKGFTDAMQKAGGKVEVPLDKAFWGAWFGMFTDKYGIDWMVNCPAGS